MKFLADVNIPQSVIAHLKHTHHDILDIKIRDLSTKDIEIIKFAQLESRIVLTLDKDFIALTQFPKYKVATIVIRLKKQDPQNMIRYLDELIKNQKEGILQESLTIITEEMADSHPF